MSWAVWCRGLTMWCSRRYLQVLHARGVHRHRRQARVVRHKHGHGQVLTVAHFVHVGEDARVQVLCVHVQIPGGRAAAEGLDE